MTSPESPEGPEITRESQKKVTWLTYVRAFELDTPRFNNTIDNNNDNTPNLYEAFQDTLGHK